MFSSLLVDQLFFKSSRETQFIAAVAAVAVAVVAVAVAS